MAPARPALHLGGLGLLKVRPLGPDETVDAISRAAEPATRPMLDDVARRADATGAERVQALARGQPLREGPQALGQAEPTPSLLRLPSERERTLC